MVSTSVAPTIFKNIHSNLPSTLAAQSSVKIIAFEVEQSFKINILRVVLELKLRSPNDHFLFKTSIPHILLKVDLVEAFRNQKVSLFYFRYQLPTNSKGSALAIKLELSAHVES